MASPNVNLDVDDYSIRELRDLLGVPGDASRAEVEAARERLATQLLAQQTDQPRMHEVQNFIDAAADRLAASVGGEQARHADQQTDKKADPGAGTWSETTVPVGQYGSHVLIENPNSIAGKHAQIIGGRQALSGGAPPGYINPVNVRTTMQGVCVDSRFRENYAGTDASKFSVELPSVQRKVVSVRLGAIQYPTSYYAVSGSRGNNTFVIHCNYHGAQLEGSRFEAVAVGNGAGLVQSSAAADVVPQYNYNFPWIPSSGTDVGTSGSNVGSAPFRGLGATAGGCIRMYPVATSQIAAQPTSSNYAAGAYPVGSSALLSATGQNVGLPGDRIPAWRATIPDGNYAPATADLDGFAVLEDAVNNAIALAVPGYLDQSDGFARFHELDLAEDALEQARLRPNRDICFATDVASGKSVFAAPTAATAGISAFGNDGLVGWQSDGGGSNTFVATAGTGSKFENHGFALRWAVDTSGNLDLDTSLQLRLGWDLGFRSGSYWCGGVPYAPGWEGTPGFSFAGAATTPVASQSTIGSATSEGIALLVGPSYGFLSVNDHQTSTGPSLVSGHLGTRLDAYVMARIPLSPTLVGQHPMLPVEAQGSMLEVNQVREYFGPVDISRLDIALLDEYGRLIDLNNMDWSFTLAFEKLYS
jgi:hypothetical protein